MSCFCVPCLGDYSRRIVRPWLFWLQLLLLGFAAVPAPAADQVVISEFLASNSNGLRDEDGDYSDWIELFNSGVTPVALGGWFLTDTASDLAKWSFPPTNMAPGGFLVVFASGKDRRVPGAPLHTRFSLSAGGEYLALIRPDGGIATEFSPVFPEQFPNVSYGLGQDLRVTTLVSSANPAQVLIPADGALGNTWWATGF